jgi:RimJ/RimL family protein N-acetyltransferase
MKKINIVGKKTRLTLFSKKDINFKYIKWLNNKNLLRYSNNRFKKITYHTLKKYFLSFDNKNNFFFKISSLNNVFIGTTTCYIDRNHKTANIGIMIGDKQFTNKGFGVDAWISLINYLFKEKKINKIYAGTMDCNIGMKKICKKSGMKMEARFKDHEKLGKKYHDLVFFSIFRK